MIFVTVGTQLPFPRLMDAMERIAVAGSERVVAQTGPGRSDWPHLDARPQLSPAAFEALCAEARVIVAHLGIGTLLTARRIGRPLVVLPRRAALGEHRNDHQIATARAVAGLAGVHVAWEAADLAPLVARDDLALPSETPSPEREALVARLADFLAEAGAEGRR